MRQLLLCRRTFIAVLSLAALVAISLINHLDVSYAIASVSIALGAANATENSMRHKFEAQAAAPKE